MRTGIARAGLVAVLAAAAAFPWLIGLSYSKGNDFFYWLHFAWLLGPYLTGGALPDWTMFSGSGQPVFNLDHIPDAIALGWFALWFGLEGGMRLYVPVCYALAGVGVYFLSLELCGRSGSATLGALVYVLSWYLTRTADFYVYTSNLLELALLPWLVFAYRRAAAGEFGLQLLAGAITALCITANPQMAIKVVVFASGWVLAESLFWRRQNLGRVIGALGVVGVVAAWLSAFHIASALIHRQETYTFGDRGTIWPRDWGSFTAIPRYAFDQLTARLGWASVFEVPLWEVIDSHYEGIGVLALALFAWGAGRGEQRRQAQVLWGLSAVAVAGFFVLSWGRASEWMGTPRNMLFIPTFCLALLAASGHARFWEKWAGSRGWKWGVPALVLLELAGLKAAFFFQGPHHMPLGRIPHLEFWKEFSQAQEWRPGERFFTFKSDLAFMLFPAFTGRPIANLIHQRDYSAEYFSYQDTLSKYLAAKGPHRIPVSEYLGLLGVRYVDLPRTGFVGRFAPQQAQLLAHFQADPGLREVARRSPDWRDEQWLRARLDTSGVEQVIFENLRARPFWLAPKVIAILGDTRQGEKRFEELALDPAFQCDRKLYLLCAEPGELAGLEGALDQVLPAIPYTPAPPPWRQVDLEELKAEYREDHGWERGDEVRAVVWEEERVELTFAPATKARFAGVALQRFGDWKAEDGRGRHLRLFKAGAGLTAVHLPPETDQVVLRYERPAFKTGWRWFSLAGALVVAAAAILGCFGPRRTP